MPHKPLATPETAPIHPVAVTCTHYDLGINFDPRPHTAFAYRIIGIVETVDGKEQFKGLHQTHSAELDTAAKTAIQNEAARVLGL